MLSLFYYDWMVARTPGDFTKMVNMGIRLEEGVRQGRLKESGSSDSSIRYENGLSKKKEHDANVTLQEKRIRSLRSNQCHQHVTLVTPIINLALIVQVAPVRPQF